MSEYTTESQLSVRARQRRRRSLITLGIVLLGLFFAFWYALSYYQSGDSAIGSANSGPTCTPYDPKAVTPPNTSVNVYNASTRNGLAASVSKSLAARGYVIGKVANDPSSRKAPTVAEIRYGSSGDARAKLLLTALPKDSKLHKDKRKGATVDLVLGAKFTTLVPVSTSTVPMCPAPTDAASATP
jgi:hypothetical protein